MLLIVRDAIARAHGAAVLAPARADADASGRREREAAPIIGEGEMRLQSRSSIPCAQPQILIDAVRVHDLARIHPAAGIPDRLEFAKRLHQLGAEHLWQELRLRLAVPVFA